MQTISLRNLFSILAWFLLLGNTLLQPFAVMAAQPATTTVTTAHSNVTNTSTSASSTWGTDAAIKIACILDGQWFDLNNLPSSSSYECSETIECWVRFKNMWNEDTVDFAGSLSVSGWTIDHSRTATTGNISCNQTWADSYDCDWVVPAGKNEDLIIYIDLPSTTGSFTVDWDIFASNDTTAWNNTNTHTVNYTCDTDETICTDTSLASNTINLTSWEDFDVTCTWENVNTYMVTVELGGNVVATNANLPAVNDTASWTYTPTVAWDYTFTCTAWGPYGDDICNAETGTAVVDTPVCTDPVTILTVDNYLDWTIVWLDTITLQGTVTAWATVTVNGQSATVTWTTWTTTVTLTAWANDFTIIATPADHLCPTEIETLTVVYTPATNETLCLDTELTPLVVELSSWEDFEVTCTWENVNTYMVTVELGGNVVATNANLPAVNDAASWTYTPTVAWDYTFTCTAWGPYGDDVCDAEVGTVTDTNETLCLDTSLASNIINLTDWEDFDVTCSWLNVNKYMVSVELGGNVVATNANLTAVNDVASWTYTPTVAWDYTFTCTAWGPYGDEVCNAETGTAVVDAPVCTDPVTTFTVDNYSNWDVVNTNVVTLQGTVTSWATVTVNGQSATVTWTTWTATVALTEWVNDITIVATPADHLCPTVTKNLTIVYTPVQDTTCDDLSLNPSVVVLDNWDFEITCTWSNVDTFTLSVAYNWGGFWWSINDYDNNDLHTWTYTPTVAWEHKFICTTNGSWGSDTCEATGTVIVEEELCEEPITTIDVTNFNSWDTVTTDTVTLTWTVDAPAKRVFIRMADGTIYQATITGNTWSVDVTLLPGNNTFKIIADPIDDLCVNKVVWFELNYDVQVPSSCDETVLTPQVVALNDWQFVVVCEWTNIDKYIVAVTLDWEALGNSWPLIDSDNNDVETWNYTPTTTWSYGFTCRGFSLQNGEHVCNAVTGTVVPEEEVCEEPINTINVTNYNTGDVVNSNAVTITWTLDEPARRVFIRLADWTQFEGTVTGNTWSIDANLLQWANTFQIIAAPSDTTCTNKKIWFTLNYETAQCEHPVSVTIANITNGQQFDTNTITVQASATPLENVDFVTINWVVATLVNGLYEADVTLTEWSNAISVVAHSIDWECDTVTATTTVVYNVAEICEDPFTITIDTPSDNSSTSSTNVTVRGSVSDVDAIVTVNGEEVEVWINWGFETIVSLATGNNEIIVRAVNWDVLCNEEVTIDVEKRRRLTWGSSGRNSSITCGNGKVDSWEQCDDGNFRSEDWCSASCQIEVQPICGNWIVERWEECDDRNSTNGDWCTSVCMLEEIVIPTPVKKTVVVTKIRPQPLEFRATPPILPATGMIVRFAPSRVVAQ